MKNKNAILSIILGIIGIIIFFLLIRLSKNIIELFWSLTPCALGVGSGIFSKIKKESKKLSSFGIIISSSAIVLIFLFLGMLIWAVSMD